MRTRLNLQKIFIGTGVCLLSHQISFAQKQNVYFLKDNGKYVSTRDSADYIRILSEPDSGTKLYNLKEFYPSGKPKRIGKSSEIDFIVLEGQCVEFYSSGKRKEMATYRQGRTIDDVYSYYPNGKLYQVKQYDNSKKGVYQGMDGGYTITACNDSTGRALVVDGNGYYLGFDDDFKYIFEEGKLKAGLRDGDWKGQRVYKTSKLTFTEQYDNGKLLSGQTVDSAGNIINYAQRETLPEYNGGEQAFGNFLGRNIHYPVYAKEHHVQGRVYLTFVVESDGTLTDMKAVRSPGGGLTEESLRVLRMSPNWIPGKQFGRPVRVQYTVPINFALGD